MAGMNLFEAYVKIGADINDAKKGIDAVKKEMDGYRTATKHTTERAKGQWSGLFSTIRREGPEALNAISAKTVALGNIIASVLKSAAQAAVGFGKSAVTTAADIAAETAQFEATFGDLQAAANGAFSSVSRDTGILATRLKNVGTKAFSQFKGAGLDAASALSSMDTYTRLAADAAAYYDISLEDADARLRSFLRGNTEAGDAIGLFTSESQRNAKALEVYGMKWLDLNEAQKQMLMLNVAQDIYEQSGAIGQAQREADGWTNVTGNLQEAWRQLTGVIGAPFTEGITPVLQKVTEFFSDDTVRMRIGLLAEDLGELAGKAFDGVVSFIDSLINWSNGESDSEMANTLLSIFSGLGEIAGLVFNGVKDFLDVLFNGMDEGAAENVQALIEDISGLVNNEAFQTAAAVVGAIVAAFLIFKNPAILIGIAIGAIATHWKEIQEWCGKAKEAIENFLNSPIGKLLELFFSPLLAAVEAIKYIVAHWDEIKEKFSNSPIGTILETLFAPFSAASEAIKYIIDHWGEVEEFFSNSPLGTVLQTLFSPLLSVVNTLGDIVVNWKDVEEWCEKAKTAFVDFVETHVPEPFASAIISALEWIEEKIKAISELWKSWTGSFSEERTQTGASAIDAHFKQGDIWGGIVEGFKQVYGGGGGNDNSPGGRSVTGNERSFATGLDYVPYNEFPARLHVGEAVLTRAEADSWRAGGNESALDYTALAQAVGVAVREALAGVNVNIDGQRAGSILTETVSRNIAQMSRNRRYQTV